MKAFFIKTKPYKNIEAYYYFKEILKPQLVNLNDYDSIIDKIMSDNFYKEKYRLVYSEYLHNSERTNLTVNFILDKKNKIGYIKIKNAKISNIIYFKNKK
jgi:replicative DNA helicase